MFRNSKERVKRLSVGFEPEADVPYPVLFKSERTTILLFRAVIMKDGRRDTVGVGILEFEMCLLAKFGYPNDEAIPGHPLAKKGLGYYNIFEVENSSWIKDITRMNRIPFPNTKDDTVSSHFVVTFHDSTFECIAKDLHPKFEIGKYKEILDSKYLEFQ